MRDTAFDAEILKNLARNVRRLRVAQGLSGCPGHTDEDKRDVHLTKVARIAKALRARVPELLEWVRRSSVTTCIVLH